MPENEEPPAKLVGYFCSSEKIYPKTKKSAFKRLTSAVISVKIAIDKNLSIIVAGQ